MNSKILMYIELPPPMHGMTYINKILYEHLKDDDSYLFYDTNFTVEVDEVGNVSVKKIIKNISIMFGAWRSFFTIKPYVVYSLLSASLFGIVRDFMINLPSIVLKKQLVLHLHGFTYYTIYKKSKIYKILFDMISKNAKLIVLCDKQKKITLEMMHKESYVLSNCLHKAFEYKKRNKNDILTICYISNISKQKGTFELINAVKKMDNVKLIIAGNFLDNKEEFYELIKNTKSIEYLGFANEKLKDNILSNSDIFCLPSKLEEGSPISIIEAMAYGLPIVSTNKGCIKDMIDGIGVVLKDNHMHVDIIDAIRYIDINFDALSQKSFEKYTDNYSKENFIQNMKNILKGETINVQK